MGIARDPTANYHPQHTGIERMHRILNNPIRARLLGRMNWLSELQRVMLGLRAASNYDSGVSPSISVSGQLVVQRPAIDDDSTFERKLASAIGAQTIHEKPQHDKRRRRSYVPHYPCTAKCVLVRVDKVQSSLVRVPTDSIRRYRIKRYYRIWREVKRWWHGQSVAVRRCLLSHDSRRLWGVVCPIGGFIGHEKRSRSLVCATRPMDDEVWVSVRRSSTIVAYSKVNRLISGTAPLE